MNMDTFADIKDYHCIRFYSNQLCNVAKTVKWKCTEVTLLLLQGNNKHCYCLCMYRTTHYNTFCGSW